MKRLMILLVALMVASVSFGENGPSPLITPSSVSGLGTIATVDSPVPVANGGTGATTAATGLAALGGASLNGSSTVGFAADNLVLGATGAGADSTLVRQNTCGKFLTTDATHFVLNCFTATDNNLADPFSQTTGEPSKNWYYGLYGQKAYFNEPRFIIMNAGVPKLSIIHDGQVLVATSTPDGINKLQVDGSMRLIGMATPTATEGGIYFNSSNKHLYVYNGTAWVQLDN